MQLNGTTHERSDVVVVGAGPAGSATAALLAERGLRVLLLERAAFPRPKPCAEYLSPEAARVLDRLGVGAALRAERPARLTGMRIVSPAGTSVIGRFRGAHEYRGYRDYGLALPREILDSHLAAAAQRHGAQLWERAVVEGLEPDAGGWRLSVRQSGGRGVVRARLVIGADGLHSRVAHRLGTVRRGRRTRVALVTHAAGVTGMGGVGEMHVSGVGYLGLAPVGRGLTNLALVVDRRRVVPEGRPEHWLRRALEAYPAVLERLREAAFVTPVRAVGPFARWTTRATGDGIVLVGDAADFYDPFTGEGIYAALRGAELAAGQVAQALESGRWRAADLAPYDAARRRAFGGKWLVERLVSWTVAHPAVFEHVVRRLAARPHLADLLVGVTGDFVPPSRVLRPSYVWGLVR